MVNDKNIYRTLLGFQFEPELFPQRRLEVRSRQIRLDIRTGWHGVMDLACPLKNEIEGPTEPRLVQHGAAQARLSTQ